MKIRNGMVVSAHRRASEVGAAVLRKGGNAFDAAVATSLMLGVVEPAFSGIGGGGFALMHTAAGEDLALDYREVAPLDALSTMFSEGSDSNRVGALAVATPGLLAGHAKLLEEHGTMEFADLARPAIDAAMSEKSESLSWAMLEGSKSPATEKLARFESSANVFIGKNSLPLLGETLSLLSREGPGSFYEGQIPERVANHLKSLGGILSAEDFRRYVPKMRTPVSGEHSGYRLMSMPPPSAGGALIVKGLRILEEVGGVKVSPVEPDGVKVTAAVLKSMLSEKWKFGDPDFADVPLAAMLSGDSVRRAAEEVRSASSGPPLDFLPGPGSTSHFCVLDKQGNAVAATETIECFYGSGVTVPGLGMVLNDEMHDFDVFPGKPNSVEPLKRPASSMSPTIALKDGEPSLILGGAGSERIISSVFQVASKVIDGKMPLPYAISEPRVHPVGGRLMVEGGLGDATLESLKKWGVPLEERPKHDLFFGGVQAIAVDVASGKVTGSADPRRQGAAAAE